jgi:hypothetical protein
MDRWIIALVVGLLGGVGGAIAVRLLFAEAPSHAVETPAGGVDERLERIEASLASLAARGPLLEAAPAAPRSGAGGADGAGLGLAFTGPQGEAFKQALREELGAALDQHAAKVRAAGDEAARAAKAKDPEKKRVSLADAARELALTAQQEDELRRIYADSQEKMMRLVAGENGDVEAVRRDLDEAKRDPKKRSGMMMKYMPRVLPKMGEFLQITFDQQAAVDAAVGPDKAARLQDEFDVIEANPLGGGEMRVESRVGDR